MPPTTKPDVKKTKAELKKVAVAALVVLLLAVFAEAQQVTADQALQGFRDFLRQVLLGVRTAIALAFWAAIAIIVAHFALGKIAPTRFQRMGAFWDGLERAKDIIYGYAWLFLLIFAIYTAMGVVANGGKFDAENFGAVVKWMMIDPFVEVWRQLSS